MALRILLADESATIKKVIELSLQDYSVDLKTVNLGVDVLEVTKNFQPDLIFVDILLQKKNGYEVCHELKQSPETKNIPVVILWSGFMELDPQKMKVCGADDSLEKPFDSDGLRSIVSKFVPRVKDANPLLQHIKIPKIEKPEEFTQVLNRDDIPDEEESENWNMDSFEDLPELDLSDGLESLDQTEDPDDFSQFEIKGKSLAKQPPKVLSLIDNDSDDDDSAEWVSKKLGKFQLDVPEEEDQLDELSNISVPEMIDSINDTSFLWSADASDSSPNDESSELEGVDLEQRLSSSDTYLEEEQSITEPNDDIWNTSSDEDDLEISLDPTSDSFEIERNEDIGIEVLSDDPVINPSNQKISAIPYPSSGNEIDNFLNSEKFKQILEIKLEERLQEIVESLVPKIAKKAIEVEIQRLLNDPYE